MNPALDIVHSDVAAHAGQPSRRHCVSCDAQVQGNFCSHCGESTHPHPPSAGEFVHEFVGHYVALEGKLFTTLRQLLFKPGSLSADFLRGRRVPTINPLRLYLTLSLVLFALIKLVGVDLPQLFIDDNIFGVRYTHTVPDPETGKPRTALLDIKAAVTGTVNPDLVRETVTRLAGVNSTWAANLQRFAEAPPEHKAATLNQGFLTYLPYMLIGALPLFALYLTLLYRRAGRNRPGHTRSGHNYGEHLVFSLHFSAFVFLLASAMMLIPGNVGWLVVAIYTQNLQLASSWDWFQLLPLLWIVAYLPAALRRVYGGTRLAAWAAALLLLAVHMMVILNLVAGAEIMAVLRHG